MENPKFNFQPMVLYSHEDEVRYKGSSGGVITQLVKYLFENNFINSAIGFKFKGKELFVPYLIYSFKEYTQSGSIYHEVNIYKYLIDNLENIKSPIFITCLPCQIVPIKRLLEKHHLESYIVSLVCSAQLEKEATYYFLENNNININNVESLRYRGNGWPSGMQVKASGKKYFFHNNTSKWIDIFHSQIFNLNKCFSCSDTFGINSDLSIADPWLQRYIDNDKIGSSIVIPHTRKGDKLIKQMISTNVLISVEKLSQEEVLFSQKGTLIKKYFFKKYKKQLKVLVKIVRSNFYKKYFFYFSKLHTYIFLKIIAILKKLEGIK